MKKVTDIGWEEMWKVRCHGPSEENGRRNTLDHRTKLSPGGKAHTQSAVAKRKSQKERESVEKQRPARRH